MRIMPFMKRKKGIQFAGTGLDTGGGVTDYDDLSNKPQIGGVTLTGNKTLADLGVQSVLTFDNIPTANSDNPVKSGGVASTLSKKMGTKSTYTQIGSAVTTDEPTIVSNIAQWVSTNEFVGSLTFDYYGIWGAQMVSTHVPNNYYITVNNQIGDRYVIMCNDAGQISLARKITGTVTTITTT